MTLYVLYSSMSTTSSTSLWFDGTKYITLQTKAIQDRLALFPGKLYLEIGGHFLIDNHASRVLPGYDPSSKEIIFKALATDAEILYCINAKDIVRDRQFDEKHVAFDRYVRKELEMIEKKLQIRPQIIITMLDHDFIPYPVREFEDSLTASWYTVSHKYLIDNYPSDTATILSDQGYGADDYIQTTKKLILVTACGSNSGKLGTCLSQLYLDHTHGIQSGYAKFETFPIWNTDLHHPANLAYEAATADIGDYNMIDTYHQKAYGIDAINYNRDVEAFQILQSFYTILSPKLQSTKTPKYQSPTDMGINMVWFALIDTAEAKKAISDACHTEIQRRLSLFQKLLLSGHGEEEAVERCENLLKRFR